MDLATDLYRRMLDFNYKSDERAELMEEVWRGTPWMLDVDTGTINDDREREIIGWCYDNLGRQAFPFGDEPRRGSWQRGGATVNGWIWIGFETREIMQQFIEAFPDSVKLEPETA